MENKSMVFFHSPEEKLVAILGKSSYQKYVSTEVVNKGFAVLSNKRLYIEGKSYKGKNGVRGYQKTKQESNIDLCDIVSVGYEASPIYKWVLPLLLSVICIVIGVIMGAAMLASIPFMGNLNSGEINEVIIYTILFVAIVLLGIFCINKFVKERREFITIQYAGGVVAFEYNWFSRQEIEEFKNILYIEKDNVLSKNVETVASNVQTIPTQKVSVADEISKMNELLAQGVISQEEFNKAKKELLGI